jgi:hypothetical protein
MITFVLSRSLVKISPWERDGIHNFANDQEWALRKLRTGGEMFS